MLIKPATVWLTAIIDKHIVDAASCRILGKSGKMPLSQSRALVNMHTHMLGMDQQLILAMAVLGV
jgi:hypothetical protein